MASRKRSSSIPTSKSLNLLKYLGGLTPLQALALTKFSVVPKELVGELTDQVSAGCHVVDFIVRFRGELTKNPDHEKKPTSSIPWLVVVALLIRRSGATRKKSVSMLFEILKEAIELNKETEEVREEILEKTGVRDAMEQLSEHIDDLPKITARGHVSKRYEVDLLADIEATHLR